MPSPIPFLPIIDKALAIFQDWQKNRPMNKLRDRLESAMSYIHADRKEGEFKDMTDAEIKKKKVHFAKKVFDE